MIQKITADTSGQRLDAFISEKLDITRSSAQNICESGGVLCCGAAVKKNYKVKAGDEIEVTLPEVRECETVAQEIPLDIRYEDEHLIVINKPRGMVVHPAAGHFDGTLVNALLAHCGDSLSGIGGEQRPGIVHRIDKDTSGLLIVAKNDKAHIALSAQLADRSLSRTYDAVVYGRLEEAGTVNAPIGRSSKDRKKMAITNDGRHAVTHYEPVSYVNGFSHIKCKLETGRTHQIRVHMASIGHAVAGDPLYGPKNDKTKLEGQCLHASKLRFVHPATQEHIEIECELPEYFVNFIKRIGLE
ncbi:MAG: RluA family pseudouridine synthase [Clostridia bacterium]|nr:RluA family pseudouridine synthase [Clostridia bacterium]